MSAPTDAPAVTDDLHGKPLTAREVQILRLLADGHTDPSIATALHLSPNTVKAHMRRIFTKLGARSRANAVSLGYLQRVLLVPGPVAVKAFPRVSEQAVLVRRWVSTGKAQIVRRGAGLTRAQVAADCGVTGSVVAGWETGVVRPSGEPLEAYYRALVAMAQAAEERAA